MAKVSFPVAADTNYLLRLAEGDDDAWDALEVLTRLRRHPRIATRTVLQELAHQAGDSAHPQLASVALRALKSFKRDWGFEPGHAQFPLNHDDIGALAHQFVRRGLLPDRERHDARILAEAAFSRAVVLVSEDSDLRDVDALELSICLQPWNSRRL